MYPNKSVNTKNYDMKNNYHQTTSRGIIATILFLVLIQFNGWSQTKVIGYLPSSWGDVNSIDYTKLTHINIAFANPDNAGNLSVPAGMTTAIQKAHANNVKAIISLGGAGAPAAAWSSLLQDGNRSAFIQKISSYVTNYQLDGVDIDLEGDRIDGNYEKFIVDLSAAIKPKNKTLTFAIATWQGNQITDRALALFDWVNVMSYDYTGPWTANSPGQHSPYSGAVNELNYWISTRKVAKEKVILGVPFYGYQFNNGTVNAYVFGDIVKMYPGSENVDEWNTGAGMLYYNGIPTIKKKTTLAKTTAGGIMIWQLFGDATGSKSLLSAIDQIMKSGGNNAPAVSITSPVNNASFTAGSSITINANASDSDGGVSSVQFLYNGTPIATDATSPYSATWTPTAAGTYSLTAKATDNSGAVTTSSTVTITVNAVVAQGPYGGTARPIPGKIEAEQYDLGGQGVAYNDLTTANEGGAFRTDAVDVEACSDAGTGYNIGYVRAGEWLEYTVNVTAGTYTLDVRVAAMSAGNTFHFELDGKNISGPITVPNTGGWQNWHTVTVTTTALAAGNNKVLRVYMDGTDFNLNHFTFTPVVTNKAPSVSIASPSNNASFTVGSTITINANASDSDGSVSSVQFLYNGTPIATDATSPYSATWTPTAAGTYSLTAKATDNSGAVTTSSTVTITVNAVVAQTPYGGSARPIPGKIEAEHYDLGGQGIAYNDLTSTNEGGSFRNDAVDVEACSDAGTGYNVGYVRAGEWLEYTVNVNAGTYKLDVRVAAMSAGNTFHLELDGLNISGPITVPNTGAWQNWQTVTVTTTSLTAGNNKVLRVYMDGTDFNLNYFTFSPVTTNKAPTVSIASPANNSTFNSPASITFSANATDSDGTVTKVEYFNGSQSIGSSSASPYNVAWNNVAAGTYTITAKATDNSNAVTSSSAITINVKTVVSNQPPAVSISSPANNASFNAPASITFSANATDVDGTITKVEYFNGSQSIGSSSNAGYNVTWNNVAAGTYIITAKATDNSNAVTTSSSITITVNTISTNACSGIAQYVENGGYIAGSKVQNAGSSYECKPYPYSGWCNGAAWAYAPGTGSYWTDAWTLVGSCSPSTPSMSTSPAQVSPNPAVSNSNLTFSLPQAGMTSVILYDGMGNIVQQVYNGYMDAGAHQLTIDFSKVPSGYYYCKIISGGFSETTTIMKAAY